MRACCCSFVVVVLCVCVCFLRDVCCCLSCIDCFGCTLTSQCPFVVLIVRKWETCKAPSSPRTVENSKKWVASFIDFRRGMYVRSLAFSKNSSFAVSLLQSFLAQGVLITSLYNILTAHFAFLWPSNVLTNSPQHLAYSNHIISLSSSSSTSVSRVPTYWIASNRGGTNPFWASTSALVSTGLMPWLW